VRVIERKRREEGEKGGKVAVKCKCNGSKFKRRLKLTASHASKSWKSWAKTKTIR
jgi:hypothetical protein